mmetsp:Transcript_25816/g.63869  ORF Transcript_25816/g.63869 Transcript_25816/m.63869 type:complete len:204 (-) Transcript_25816:71-682(-)
MKGTTKERRREIRFWMKTSRWPNGLTVGSISNSSGKQSMEAIRMMSTQMVKRNLNKLRAEGPSVERSRTARWISVNAAAKPKTVESVIKGKQMKLAGAVSKPTHTLLYPILSLIGLLAMVPGLKMAVRVQARTNVTPHTSPLAHNSCSGMMVSCKGFVRIRHPISPRPGRPSGALLNGGRKPLSSWYFCKNFDCNGTKQKVEV